MFLFRDPRHHHVHITDALLLTSAFVNTLADHDYLFRGYINFQEAALPTACKFLCVRFVYLVQISGTSYGGLSIEPTPNVL